MTITWVFRGRRNALLRVSRHTWGEMMAQLAHRGQGHAESGAFLMAARSGDQRTVVRAVYLDDLDSNCLQGHIRFDGRAYSKLWDICDNEGLVAIGDVHTHPGAGVEQSSIDAENPMIVKTGHIALIVPGLALRPVKATEVGVHRYGGAAGWESWLGKAAARRLWIGWF
jgi:proteasome lid subunit RPN8/RPN11